METARATDRPDCWRRLAQQTLKQGNHIVSVSCEIHDIPPGLFSAVGRGEGVSTDQGFRPIVVLVPCKWQHRQVVQDAENRRV